MHRMAGGLDQRGWEWRGPVPAFRRERELSGRPLGGAASRLAQLSLWKRENKRGICGGGLPVLCPIIQEPRNQFLHFQNPPLSSFCKGGGSGIGTVRMWHSRPRLCNCSFRLRFRVPPSGGLCSGFFCFGIPDRDRVNTEPYSEPHSSEPGFRFLLSGVPAVWPTGNQPGPRERGTEPEAPGDRHHTLPPHQPVSGCLLIFPVLRIVPASPWIAYGAAVGCYGKRKGHAARTGVLVRGHDREGKSPACRGSAGNEAG